MPAEHLSMIALLNSETDTKPVMDLVLKKMTSQSPVQETQDMSLQSTAKLEVEWTGHYLDEEANLAVVVKQDKPGEISVNCGGHDEKLQVKDKSMAKSKDMQVSFESAGIQIQRPHEHRTYVARPLSKSSGNLNATKFIGKYYSEEINSTLHVTGSGAMLYGAFDGFLGNGPIHVMRWLGENVWWLACWRSLDAAPPGNWSVVFQAGTEVDSIIGATVGCWLARKVQYKKVE